MAVNPHFDILKILKDIVPFTKSRKELETKQELNQIIFKQLQEGYLEGSILYGDYNLTLVVLAARAIKEGFPLDAVTFLGEVDPDYIRTDLLKDLEKDAIFQQEVDLIVQIIAKLLPNPDVDINVLNETTKNYV